MKKKYTIFLLLSVGIWLVPSNARNMEELFLRANKCYETNDIEQALTLYQSIDQKGPATWYNMGNCFYKKDDYPHALVCWKRAERDATLSELSTIEHNIGILEQKSGKSSQQGMFVTGYRSIKKYVSLLSLTVVQVSFLIMLIVLLSFVKRLIRTKRYSILTLLLGITTILAAVLIIKYAMQTCYVGMVMQPTISVLAGPNEQYHIVGSLDAMTELVVQEQREGWMKVLSSAIVGWVPVGTVEIL